MNKNDIKQTKTAFTLAEVLITLMIIGVIASLTITVIQQVQYAELKAAFKKVYSDFGSATQRLMLDNGGVMEGVLTGGHEAARDKYLQYMKSIKTCRSYDNSCGTDYCSYFNSIKSKDGSGIDQSLMGNCTGWGGGFAALDNGMFFTITSAWNGGNSTTCSPFCAKISVDVNGFKGPNRFGRDIFGLFVYESNIKPFGSQGDLYVSDPKYNDAAKVLRDESY